MQAAVLVGPSTFKLENVDLPETTANWPQIRVAACGICGSDLAIYHRSPPIPKYWPGHEIAGYLGDQLVVVNPLLSCGMCEFCRNGKENICRNARMISLDLPGGFAEFLSVPYDSIRPIQASVRSAVCVEPLASSLHMLTMAQNVRNQRIVIIGGGTIGLMLLQLAYWREAKIVKLITRYPIQEHLGAKWGSVSTDFEPDIVFVAAAGDGSALQYAVDIAKPNGQVVVAGNIYSSRSLNLKWLVEHELMVLGSQRYTVSEFEEAAQLIELETIDTALLITHQFDLSDISLAYSVASRKAEHQSVKVLVRPGSLMKD
jgi:alcohol dehydrogenase